MEKLLPRHLQIIYQINQAHLDVRILDFFFSFALRVSIMTNCIDDSWDGHVTIYSLSAEYCSSLSKRHGQAEENVSDWRGRRQEGEHGAPVHRGIARSQRSRWDTLQHHQDPSVSPLLLDAVKKSIKYQTKDQTSAAAAIKFSKKKKRKSLNVIITDAFKRESLHHLLLNEHGFICYNRTESLPLLFTITSTACWNSPKGQNPQYLCGTVMLKDIFRWLLVDVYCPIFFFFFFFPKTKAKWVTLMFARFQTRKHNTNF